MTILADSLILPNYRGASMSAIVTTTSKYSEAVVFQNGKQVAARCFEGPDRETRSVDFATLFTNDVAIESIPC